MDLYDKYFVSPSGLREAMIEAGLANYQHRPHELLGKPFRFECATPNDDSANPRETDRNVIYGTVLGIHFDGGIAEIVLTVTNTCIGLDTITKISFYLIGQRWYLASFDGTAYDDHDGTMEILA